MISGVVADAWDRRRLMLFTQIGVGARRGRRWRSLTLSRASRPSGRSTRSPRSAPRSAPSICRRGRRSCRRWCRASTCPTRSASTRSCSRPRRCRARRSAASLIAATGVGWVYVANAVSFGFVIVALLMMRDVPARPTSEAGSRDDVSLARGDGGAALRVPLAAHPLDDAARFLRDVLLVGDRAAADLRAGHPAASARRATAGCTPRRRSARW